MAERSYPTSEVRGGSREEQTTPKARGSDERSYPTPLSPRPRAAAGRSNPMSKKPRLRGRRRA